MCLPTLVHGGALCDITKGSFPKPKIYSLESGASKESKKIDFSSLFTDQQGADIEARELRQVHFASYTMLNARLDRPTECDVQIRHR